jgi:hypothetical protein
MAADGEDRSAANNGNTDVTTTQQGAAKEPREPIAFDAEATVLLDEPNG